MAVPAKGQARGSQRERAVRDWYRERGWLAFRAPASLGVADVIAMRRDSAASLDNVIARVHLVEVKATTRSAWVACLPADRERLRAAAELAGAVPLIAWWPPRGELRFYGVDEWPGAGA